MGKRRVSRQALARFRERGHKAFLRGAYTEAIEEWEKVKAVKPSMLPAKTLAEAYFRRGVTRFYEKDGQREEALEDLQRAVELVPGEALYHYHLGLMYHHRGDAGEALAHYRKAQKGDAALKERLAYPMLLALLHRGDRPKEHELWQDLAPEEQAMVEDAAVFNRRPYAVSEDAPLLWKAMAALDEDDLVQAALLLKKNVDQDTSQIETALTHYYLGVVAARNDDMQAARHHWIRAAGEGLDTATLTLNLGESFHRLAEARLEAGDAEGAFAAAREALRHKPDQRSLHLLLSQVHQHLGYRAAQRGAWGAAEEHWDRAYELEDGNFRMAFNLALCYEREGEDIFAGETWREVLRRRPRLEDDPDALDDEQVAQIWKRSAEAYVRAGEYDEAVHVYRQAVKYNPDHLPTRMALVDSLMSNGQFAAAENELERILDKNPDYVPALVQMGDVQAAWGSWWRADPVRYWERALDLDPDNVEARESLIDYYFQEAGNRLYWNQTGAALGLYEEILSFAPNHVPTLASIGDIYLSLGDRERARGYFEQAYKQSGGDLGVYYNLALICFFHDEDAWGWEYIERAEEDLEVPLDFYIQIIGQSDKNERYDLIEPLVERVIERAGPDDEPLTMVGEALALSPLIEQAESYLRQALEAGENPARAHLSLSFMALRRGDHKEAHAHLRQAKRFARQQGDTDLLRRAQQVEESLISLPPDLLRMILNNPMGPDGPLPFPDII